MPNLLQYPVALFGVLRAGMVVVNINPQYSPCEFAHQLNDSRAKAIVVLENFAGTLAQVVGSTPVQTVITTQVVDLLPPLRRWLNNALVKHVKKMVPPWQIAGALAFNRVLAIGSRNELDDVALAHGDLAFLQYTGGNTGAPKAAMTNHGNMVANVLQVAAWIGRDLKDGVETLVIPLPLYHVFALTGTLAFFSKGVPAVLIANPHDTPDFLKTLDRARPTAIIGVSTLFSGLARRTRVRGAGLEPAEAGGRRRHGRSKGGRSTLEGRHGHSFGEGYGMSESAPVAIANPIDIMQWSGQIGMPLPSTAATSRWHSWASQRTAAQRPAACRLAR